MTLPEDSTRPPRIVVFGWGNPSRGDDAIGPILLAELEALALPGVVTVEDFQLQIEHALDLVGADLALFIDAGTGTPAPYTFAEIGPRAEFTASTHALAPEAVLAVFRQVRGSEPPPAFVLCVRGESFGLGEPMTQQAQAHLRQAALLLERLMARADASHWREITAGSAAPDEGEPASAAV